VSRVRVRATTIREERNGIAQEELPGWGRRGGLSPAKVSLIGIAVLVIACYFAFTKSVPFRSHYTVGAVVQTSNLLVPGSPVRIGGSDVGKVTSVGRYRNTNLALVQMQISGAGEIHRDATLRIRPRLFLEGNFYVDLSPGTPDSPALPSGGTIPVAHTSTPVQIDELLDTLPADIRHRLQQALQGFGTALDAPPTAGQDAHADPRVRGLTGAEGLNGALSTSAASLRDTAIVSDALTGPDGRGLSKTIAGLAQATDGLARADGRLSDLVTEFDRTMQATASEQEPLRRAIALLGPTAQNADTAFGTLGTALPPTERFARALAEGIPQIPETIKAAYPWLAQAKPLLSPAELGGLLHELAPATRDLAQLTHNTLSFLPKIDAFDRCITGVFLPTGNIVVDDGPLSSGVPNYREFWYAMAGQAAEAQGADGNGNWLRIGAAGGPDTIETGQTNYYGAAGTKFAQADLPPLRTRPAYPNQVPELNRSVNCYTQPVPNVNGPASTGPADGARPDAAPPPLPNDPTGKIR
jgi:phospholipid/cholesterol/gamma-HCH transport system substrate-binding protein